jgi:hypothetical protein
MKIGRKSSATIPLTDLQKKIRKPALNAQVRDRVVTPSLPAQIVS